MPTTGISVWLGALIGALAAGLGRIVAAIPALLGALLILLIGWGIGKAVQWGVTRGLRALHFDQLTDRAGINRALSRANVRLDPAGILGVIAYWFIFLLAVNAAIGVLGITALTALATSFILYLPRIFAALLVLVAGAWLGSFLGRLTQDSAAAANIGFASMLGSVVLGTVLFFTFATALDLLGLGFPFLTTAFAILLGALALTAAIAFGLGGREYATDVLAGRTLRTFLNPGDYLVTDTAQGSVVAVQPMVTMLRTDRGDVTLQNSDVLRQHATKPTGQGGQGSMPKAA
jgi:hypothetical protein